MQAEGSLLSLTNLRGLWLTWSELGGAARGLVVGARRSRSGRGRRGPWSTWSELGGAARDEVNVVAVNVVGARRSCSGRSRRGRGRRGRSLAELLGT